MEDKTTTLNLIPSGIDYTTFLTFLDTNSGCVYNELGKKITRKESDERRKTENIIMVYQGYRPYGYDVRIVGDEYLSVVRYTTACSASRVKEWCANEEKGIVNDADDMYAFGGEGHRYYERTLRKDRKYSLRREVRIYKDGSSTQVIGVEYDNGERLYLCINPEIYTNSKLSSNRWYGATRLGSMGDCIDSPEAQKTLETKVKDSNNNDTDINYYIRVYTDEDVKATAVASCAKRRHIGSLFGFTDVFEGNLIEVGHLSETNAVTFGDELAQSIANFFGMKDAEGEGCEKMQIYQTKYGYHCSPATRLSTINLWSTIQLKHYAAQKSQQAKCDSIWSSVHWEDPGKVSWERRGDEIIMAIQDKNDYREIKTVFVYNVKTNKKNFYRAETNTSHTWGSLDEPKPVIPSIKTILEYCGVISTSYTYEYNKDYTRKKYIICKPLKAVMINGVTVNELFAGTNVEWILNNVDNIGEYEIAAPEICSNRYSCSMDTIKQRLVDIINDEHIGVTALLVLITTGNKLMEQLLKNKLFNLYFAEIEARVKEEYVFEDIDHLKTAHYHVRIPYHGKEKSLKKMMMMSGDQIKFINDHILLEPIEKSKYDKDEPFDCYTYQLPNLMDACEVLGIDSLASVNTEMFETILKLSTNKEDKNRCIWKNFGCYRYINKIMEPMNIKAKLEFMQKYMKADDYDGVDSNALSTYNDYLQMRNSLMALQDKYPDKDIFNPHHYPVKVGKSVKFIHYIKGMADTTRTWVREPIDSQNKFIEYIMRFFSEYGKDSELSIRERLVYDEDGELIGFRDELTPTRTLKYLHDEMSRWLSIYQDEARAAEFEKALERVRPLEWSDEKTGLSIVAPRAIEEIKNEGSVLSHCVAGYVDPICQGTENIMFIRRTDMIDEPYFTLDLTPDGVIRQIHCYANGDTRPEDIKAAYASTGRPVYNEPRDILGFVKNWIKAMKGKVKDENVHPTYCRLCALRD